MSKQTPFRQVLLLGLILAVSGWGGLTILITYALPTLGARWLFYFLLMLGLSGMAFPLVFIFHKRISGKVSPDAGVIVRQAVWFGLYGNLLAWLQLGRVLDINRAAFLAIGFIVLEFLLRMLERSRWKPGMGLSSNSHEQDNE